MHLEWKEEDYIHVERTKVRGRYLYGFEVVLCLKAQNVNHAVLMCGFVDNFRVCQGGVPLPAERETKCSIFEQSVGSAMRDFKV